MNETERRLSQNQLHLLHAVRNKSRQRADEVLQKANLTSEQMEQLKLAKQKLEDARVVVNVNLIDVMFNELTIDSVLHSGRLFNLFEIDHVFRNTNPSRLRTRLMAEFKIYGATPDIQLVLGRMANSEHPNYGALDFIHDPIVFSSPAHYGAYRFRLSDRVRRRCTFTPSDAFVVEREQVYLWRDIEGILATKIGYPSRYWFECVNDRQEPFSADGSVAYIEAQILGGVFVDEDVEALYYPETDRFNKKFFQKLERIGQRFLRQPAEGNQILPPNQPLIPY